MADSLLVNDNSCEMSLLAAGSGFVTSEGSEHPNHFSIHFALKLVSVKFAALALALPTFNFAF